ncbi:Pentatricopeptide repeat [Parasponia andersonii]|uniref:Pentatricopeptide repeat n=1 Tax=Parasponia andersonii TaxID=3476 RepID=A0A2P5BK15_PARAD|nr:Pentatricopeptide repeat [Parasponia andersonii]
MTLKYGDSGSLPLFLRFCIRLDKFILAIVLTASAHHSAIDHGKWVHSSLNKWGMEFVVGIGTTIVNRFCKCGSMAQVDKVFEEMPDNDTWAFTVVISVLAVRGFSN